MKTNNIKCVKCGKKNFILPSYNNNNGIYAYCKYCLSANSFKFDSTINDLINKSIKKDKK